MRLRRHRAERLALLLNDREQAQGEAAAAMAAAEALHPAVEPRREFRSALKAQMIREFHDAGRAARESTISISAGLATSAVQAVATRRGGLTLTQPARTQLAAIAETLGIEPDEMEAAAIESVGHQVQVTYTELDEEREVLIGAYDELDDEQRQRVLDFARSLRTQRRT